MQHSELFIFARTIDLVGKVLVSYMAVRVHHRFWQEHRIDNRVFDAMQTEQTLGFLGIGFLIAAYIIEVYISFA